MSHLLFQIAAPNFVAGFVGDFVGKQGLVSETAPILHFMIAWPIKKVADYCTSKNWSLIIVCPLDENGKPFRPTPL